MQIGSTTGDDLVQAVTFVVCVIGLVAWLRWGRGRIGYAVAPMTYLSHRIIFYVVITLDPHMPNDFVVTWSSAISLHSAFTIATAAVMMVVIRRRGARL